MKYYLITYKNWKDEVSDRCILPISIEFGSNEYHKTPTWLINAHDVDIKNENGAVSISVSNNLKTFDMKNILEVKETKEFNINQVEKYIFDSSVFPVDSSSEEKIEFLKGTLELEINQNLKEKTALRKKLYNLCRWNDEEKFKIENLKARLEELTRYNEEKISEINNLYSTVKNLDELGVSKKASTLGACVGTNLNNDGILLYEGMAVFFVAQAAGIEMDFSMQLMAAFMCVLGTIGIAGIPEAGFITLSLVLTTVGLPVEILPMLLTVDWILGRGRTVVNVLGDMTVSIALDDKNSKD